MSYLPDRDPIKHIRIDIGVKADATNIREIECHNNPHKTNIIVNLIWRIDLNPAKEVMVVDPEVVRCGR
jgi:hypothetical protein